MASHVKVLLQQYSPDRFILKVNHNAFKTRRLILPGDSPRDPKSVSFNTGYFWKGKAIGVQMHGFKIDHEKDLLPSKGVRPTFRLGTLISEAGPLVIERGQIVLERGMKEGDFQQDVIRRTNQVIVGRTRSNKVILAYYNEAMFHWVLGHLLTTVAKENPKDPLVWAMKCDGGESAHLGYRSTVFGRSTPFVGVELLP